MKLKNGYSRLMNPELMNFELMTLEQMRNLEQGSRQWIICNDGRARQVTITSVKVWKRDSSRVEVHIKFGLYRYGVISEVGRLLILDQYHHQQSFQ